MKIVFFGTPDFAVSTLEKLLSHPNFQVVGVVTQPDKRRGRGNQLIYSPVKNFIQDQNIPIFQPDKITQDIEKIESLKQLHPDIFVVVAYGQILSQKILDIPPLGSINVHGSILPKYRGAAPIQWCLYHGEKITGNTTMLMDKGMDTGNILLTSNIDISLLDNAEQLAQKLAQDGAELLIETLLKLSEITPIPQDSNKATYANKIKKEDYVINWERSPLELHNQIRAFYPHCIAMFRENPVKILNTFPLIDELWLELPEKLKGLDKQKEQLLTPSSGKPGEIINIIKGIGIVIKTGDGGLLITEVQPTGKKPQSAWDFANGTHLTRGEIWS